MARLLLRRAWYARSATLGLPEILTASSGVAGVSCGVVVAVPQILPYPRATREPLSSRTPTAAPSWSSPTGPGCPAGPASTAEQWADAQWQRAHCVKNLKQLHDVMGDLLEERFYADLERDQAERATMSMLIPPQMVNTIVPASHDGGTPTPAAFTEAFYADPVRRYMLPVFSDRRTDWPSHPHASRDSLHEHEMWTAEGLTHRYPTKVLAELLPTCPQYCGHCTRMDLVGNSTPVIAQAEVRPQAGGPLRRDARLPATAPRRARRRRLRRRRGEPAVEEPRGVRRPAAGDREHPRHPARHQGADGAAAALAAGRGPGRDGAAGHDGAGARRADRDPHPRQRRAVGDAAGRRRRPGRCSTPASATCATRACSCGASTTPPPSCSTCASRSSTARRSCPTTSTCAT